MLGTPVLVVVVAVVMVSNSVAIVRWFMCRCKHFSVSTALSDVHVLTGVTCRACAWCVCTEWCARVDGCHVSCLRVLCLHWLMCTCCVSAGSHRTCRCSVMRSTTHWRVPERATTVLTWSSVTTWWASARAGYWLLTYTTRSMRKLLHWCLQWRHLHSPDCVFEYLQATHVGRRWHVLL